ncbi:fungal-specific transcription factor domain-containing protein [Xylariales sp. PMI_506]|nr:fungal-specific transcription factor domain-containing protein [Xylariales sp. PMI_506]
MSSSSSAYRARRTPQACVACRRRKTKCDGVRPRCRHCSSRHRQCVWPDDTDIKPVLITPVSPIATVAPSPPTSAPVLLPPDSRVVKRCLDLFVQYHWATDFCCFIYRPDLEVHHAENPFLITSIIALCSRYLTKDEAQTLFGLEDAHQVWSRYTPMARSLAKEASDDPSVANIQANLILGHSELLGDAGSTHWLHIGTAIRMAQMMRLNREFHQRHSLKDQEIRRRTFWACLLFDRLISFLLAKPRTLYELHISVALPVSETSLVYGEATNGLTLENLGVGGFVGRISDTGLLPFYIKTLTLWSAVADIKICGGRFFEKTAPTHPASRFFQRHKRLRDWVAALPVSLTWSIENFEMHRAVGHGPIFVTMHFLLHSAFCVAHQLYLPQTNGSAILSDTTDASGWSLLRREPAFISTCVSNALAIGEMVSMIWELGESGAYMLQSVWVAAAMLSATPTFLWLQFANDLEALHPEARSQAQAYLDLFMAVMFTWKDRWAVARPWRNTMRIWTAVYRVVYLGEPIDVNGDDDGDQELPFTDSHLRAEYRPEPGNGLCPLPTGDNLTVREGSYLTNTLRLNVIDESAKRALLHGMWLQLANGWPNDFGGMDDFVLDFPVAQ